MSRLASLAALEAGVRSFIIIFQMLKSHLDANLAPKMTQIISDSDPILPNLEISYKIKLVPH